MEFSTEEVAQLSGVSIRTLHHYDEIGLLPPGMRMNGGRRVYFPEQLVILSELLWWKRHGVPLNKISPLLRSSGASRIQALVKQRKDVAKKLLKLHRGLLEMDLELALSKGEAISVEEVSQRIASWQAMGLDDEDSTYWAGEGIAAAIIAGHQQWHAMSYEEQVQQFADTISQMDRLNILLKKKVSPQDAGLQALLSHLYAEQAKCGVSLEEWKRFLLWRRDHPNGLERWDLSEEDWKCLSEAVALFGSKASEELET